MSNNRERTVGDFSPLPNDYTTDDDGLERLANSIANANPVTSNSRDILDHTRPVGDGKIRFNVSVKDNSDDGDIETLIKLGLQEHGVDKNSIRIERPHSNIVGVICDTAGLN